MSGKIDDEPQLAESSKEVGDESSWKMKSLPEQMKVMEKKTYPGLKLPRSDTDILKETLIRLEEQEEEMNEKADQNLQILRSKIDQLKESLNKLKGQSKVTGETYDDERAEELKAELHQLTEQRQEMYERIHRESKILRSVIDTLKEGLNKLKEQRQKMDKKTSKISSSETYILEETLYRLIRQKEQIYEETCYGSQFLRRKIDELEESVNRWKRRSQYIFEGFDDERAENEAELNRLKEQRTKMYERTYHESKILRSVIDTLNESLNKLKGQKKKWNVWTDDESMWSVVDRAFQRKELTFTDLQFADENWLYVDAAFRNTELYLPRRRFLYEPTLIEKPHTIRFDADFGSRVSRGHYISRRHNIYRGLLHHDILGKLNVTLKLVDQSKRLDVVNYFLNPLHHPNILKCIETGFLHRWICIAMEECHDENLHDFVQSQILTGVPFDSDKYLSYSYQLALAVQYLHRHKTFIKNLTPDAILLSVEKTTVKICEFGSIAKIKPSSVAENLDCDEISNDIHSLGFVFHYLWSYKELEIQDFPPNPSLATEDPILIPNPMLARSLLERMLSEDSSYRPSAEEVLQHEIFKPFRSVQDRYAATEEMPSSSSAGDVPKTHEQTTSTEDLLPGISSTVGDFDRLTVDNKGVVTKFGNPSGGIAISKAIRQVIPVEGVEVEVGGCFVTFPSSSFEEATSVRVKAEIDPSKWPKDFEVIAPSLDIDAPKLQKKVLVKLPTWDVSQSGKVDKVTLLHIPKDSTDWQDTKATVPVTDKPFIEFEWKDFSPVMPARKTRSKRKYRVAGSIYTSAANEVAIALHIDDSGSKSKSMVAEKVERRFNSASPPKEYKLSFNGFTACAGETVKTTLECLGTSEVKVLPKEWDVVLDKDFTLKTYQFIVVGELNEDKRISMKILVKSEGEQESYYFNCDLTIKKENSSISKNPLTREVNVNVNQSVKSKSDNKTGKNILEREAKMKYSEDNSDSTVSNTQA